MKIIRFVDLFENYSIEISNEIQRPFEWNIKKIDIYLKGITDCAKKVIINNDEFKPLQDFGTLYMYKRWVGTNCDFFIDEGGHRIVSSAILISAMYKILTLNMLQYNENYRYVCVILERVINEMKQKFRPYPSNVNDINTILNLQEFNNQTKKLTKIQTSYLYIKDYLDILLNNDEKTFSDICNYIVKYYSFLVIENEYTNIETRKTKYNLINNVQQEQDEVHRTISSLSEDAYRLGVTNFMMKTNNAKETIRKKFPLLKEEKINNILGRYLMIEIISDCGTFITKKKANFKLVQMAQEIISCNEDTRISFYNNLFNDIELFCDHLNGIDFKLPRSEQNCINIINVAAYSNIFTTAARQFMCGIYYRIGKNVFVFRGNSIIGIKDGLSTYKVWELIRDMHLFRYYILCLLNTHRSDERACLQEIIKNGPIINSDDDIDYYIDFFHEKSVELINSDTFNNTTFNDVLYKGKFTKVLVALIDGYGNNEFEKFYDSGIKCLREIDYDKDHIVPKGWITNPTTEQLTKLNKLGNIRLLNNTQNRKENDPNSLRIIQFNDVSFPQEMWGHEFTFDDIEKRQLWAADIIKEKIKFLFNFKFK